MVKNISEVNIPLERDVFMRDLLRELTGALEEVIGMELSAGFIARVGQVMGTAINDSYKKALGVEKLNDTQVAEVLVDLKRRIKGDFYLIERTDGKLVLGNRACPFESKVLNRKSLCMMTSNVFGIICSQNLGYAKVVLQETIAEGRPECRIIVYLKPSAESDSMEGREYFGRN